MLGGALALTFCGGVLYMLYSPQFQTDGFVNQILVTTAWAFLCLLALFGWSLYSNRKKLLNGFKGQERDELTRSVKLTLFYLAGFLAFLTGGALLLSYFAGLLYVLYSPQFHIDSFSERIMVLSAWSALLLLALYGWRRYSDRKHLRQVTG